MSEKTRKPLPLVQAIVFIVLVGGCVLLYLFLVNRPVAGKYVALDSQGGLDSAAITRWDIMPNGNINEIYTVFKDSGIWEVRLQDHEIVDADLGIVRRSLKHFSKFNAAEPVKMEKAKWKALGIDDSGTRVVVFEGGRMAASYIIGKLEFVDQYKSSYYIRPVNSDSVYILKEAYLDGSVIAKEENFRKRVLAPVDPSYYKTVRIVSADTNVYYLLENINGTWSTSGRSINQSKVRSYLKMLSLIQIPEFASTRVKNPPDASITIDTKFGPISLMASREQNGRWVMGSSVNVGNRLELATPQINAIFPPFRYFMP